ncbi:MAG: 4'-phosphopantetheinyl transferase superfamily protein [Gammaproteobacteria bacterium]
MAHPIDILMMRPEANQIGHWEECCLGQLAPALARRYAQLATPRRRLEWLCSRAMLLTGFKQLHAIGAPKLDVDATGRPVAADGWHVSISHSHGLVVAAIARLPIGIDVEWLHRRRAIRSMSTLPAFSGSAAFRHPADTPQGMAERLGAWTLAESVAKSAGVGLWQALECMAVLGPDRKGGPALRVDSRLPEGPWQVRMARLAEDWQCAVAVRGRGKIAPPRVWRLLPKGTIRGPEAPDWLAIPVRQRA